MPRIDVRTRMRQSQTLALVPASHPRQAVLTALAVAAAAGLSHRSLKEVGLVLLVVLVGQAALGWHNDLVDAERDRSHDRDEKPIAQGRLERGNAWFAIALAVLLVVPLSVANGVIAGICHLLILVVAMLSNVSPLRRTVLSWVPWAVTFALWPAFLAYGGWGGQDQGTPPTILMTVLAGLLGIGVHLLVSLRGLVTDNHDGIRNLPLRIALRTGAPKLLVISVVYTVIVVFAMLAAGATTGLRQ